ncbi:MAG: alpha/beta hydrolase fold domain-containing protein, partial [Alphaproteobacteria bacterium]|nr:alpha/beta hydrolase fold domain-containing protein [Alphaproteobacteria bacterium]
DRDFDTASYHAFGGGAFGLTRDDMMAYWRAYIPDDVDPTNPRASVLRADLRGLPPTHLCAAGVDVLRDETLDMNERMTAAGVATELKRYPGVCHGFAGLGRMVDASDAAVANAAAFARRRLTV